MFTKFRQTQRSHSLVLNVIKGLQCVGVSNKHYYHSSYLKYRLYQADKTVHALVDKEKQRQRLLINLIPSANYASQSVLNALGSIFQNPNSEGYIGRKYFPGTQYLDKVERLCQQRALKAFNLDETTWSVNVQSHSQQLSCLQACSAILRPHYRLLVLGLSDRSHLSKYFTTLSFNKYRSSSAVDYEALKDIINVYQPRILLSSTSASNQLIDYQAIGTICRPSGIYVLVDVTETSGLVASNLIASPFEHADVVIAGTQGSLRGPSGALIFSRKTALVQRTDIKEIEELRSLGDAIDQSVFPGHQGGPHNHAIMAMAVALKQVSTHSFKVYQRLVLANTKAFAERLLCLGYCLRVNDTPTHHLVVKLGTVDAKLVKRVLDAIWVASNVIVTENELLVGTLAMTSRGLLPNDFCWVADIIHKAISLAQKLNSIEHDTLNDDFEGGKSLAASGMETGQTCRMCDSRILEIRQEVEDWMNRWEVLSD